MRKAAVAALTVLCATGVCLCARPEAVDTHALVKELIDRRLLANCVFRVPRGLYEQFVRATRPGRPDDPPPVDAIVEEARYHLAVPADAKAKPTLTATLRFRVFDAEKRRNWRPLPAGLEWDKLTINDKPARLPRVKGAAVWNPDKPGVYTLSAEAVLDRTDGGLDWRLAVLSSVRTFVRVDSPKAWQVFDNVRGDWGPTGDAAGGTHVELPALPTGEIVLGCREPRPATERPPRYAVSGYVAWNIGAAVQQIAADLNVRIIAGKTDRLDVSLPAAADRVTITGPDVREVQGGGGSAVVFLRGRIAERTRLRVNYELPIGRGGRLTFTPPGLRDGHWAGGSLVVAGSAGGAEVLADSASGLREMDLSVVPRRAAAMTAGAPALAYAITGRDFSASVELLNLGEFALRESLADLAHYELLFRPDGTVLCKARYEVRNRARQFLKLTVPPGAVVLAARVNEKPKPLSPVHGRKGQYLLPLIRSKASVSGLVSFPVEITLTCRVAGLSRGRGEVAIPLPRVDVPIAYAWAQTYVPEGMTIRRWSGPLTNVEQYSSETAVAHLGYGRGELAEGYKLEDRLQTVAAPPPPPAPEPIRLERKLLPPRKKPAPKPPASKTVQVPQLESQEIETTVSVPDGGTLLTGGQKGGRAATQPAAGVPVLSKIPVIAGTFSNRAPVPGKGRSARPLRPSGKVAASLARNYWRSGQDLYASNDYANAAAALEKVVELAPKSTEAANARRLLGNIKLAGGKLKAQTRGEKVAAAKVRREQHAAQQDVQQRYTQTVQAARQAAGQGQFEQARAQLQVAESLGEQLGTSVVVNGGALRGLRSQVERAEQDKAATLRRRYSQLKAAGKYAEAIQTAHKLQETTARWDSDKGRKEAAGLRKEMDDLALQAARAHARQTIAPQQTWAAQTDTPAAAEDAWLAPPRSTPKRTPQPAPQPGPTGQPVSPNAARVEYGLRPAARRPAPLRTAGTAGGTGSGDTHLLGGQTIRATDVAGALRRVRAQPGRRPVDPNALGLLVTDGAIDADAAKLSEMLNRPRQLRKELAQMAQDQAALARDIGGTAVKVVLPEGADPDDLAEAVNELYGRPGSGELAKAREGGELRAESTGDNALILTGPKDKVDRAMAVLSRTDTTPRVRRMKDQMKRLARAEVAVDKVLDLSGTADESRPREPRRMQRIERLEKQAEALEKLTGAEAAAETIYVYRLRNANAEDVAPALGRVLAEGEGRRGGRDAPPPAIQPDPRSNSLIVRANPEDGKRIKQLLTQLDAPAAGPRATPQQLATDDDAISRLGRSARVRKSRIGVDLAKALDRARKAAASGQGTRDFDRAAQEVRYAETLVATNKALFTDEEYSARMAELDRLADAVEAAKSDWTAARTLAARAEVRSMQLQRILPDRRAKPPEKFRDPVAEWFKPLPTETARDVPALRASVRKLRDAGKYAEAVEVLDSIRRIDPTDQWAREWHEQLSRFGRLLDERESGAAQEWKPRVDVRRSQVPWYETLRHPRDWQEITLERRPFGAGEVSEADADQAVQRELQKVLPKLDFPGIALGDVLQFFRDVSNLNIHPKWEALRAAGVSEKTPVTVSHRNIPLETALRQTLAGTRASEPLGFVIDGGVITISTGSDLRRAAKAAPGEPDLAADWFRPGAGVRSPEDRPVRRELQKVLPKLQFPGIGLGDAIQFFRDVSSLEIEPRWARLRAVGVDERTQVNVMLTNVTLDKALRTVLSDLPGSSPVEYEIRGGRVVVYPRTDVATAKLTKVYDVRDLIFKTPDFEGPRINLNADEQRKRLAQQMAVNVKDLAGRINVNTVNGQLVVTGGDEQQEVVKGFIDRLRTARGPQVSVAGRRIAGQKAKGIQVDDFLADVQVDFEANGDGAFGSGTVAVNDPQLKQFLYANYDWAARTAPRTLDGGWGYLPAGTDRQFVAVPDGGTILLGGQRLDRQQLTTYDVPRAASQTELVRTLGRNLGQKVVVNSTNVNIDTLTANAMGVQFLNGRNGVNFTVIDEGQMRTLLELDARNAARPEAIDANNRFQETIVGTDALLANDMIANPRFAGDRDNTLDVNGNNIRLAHEKYVLIDNGSYLTAVRVGPMQHWTETPADVRFADVPADIDVPHVGRLAKFEKTLIEPTDQLVIRATYEWKGD